MMGKKKTSESTGDTDDRYAEITVIEEEKPPRPDDSTAKCRILSADPVLPNIGLETKLVNEIIDAKGDQIAKNLRNQMLTILKQGGIEAAQNFVREFSREIDKGYGEGKAEKLLQILSKDNS